MPEPVIHIDHLSRSFGVVTALDDLSLEVPAGIVFGFLGPNGAGKTTTIHLLLGLLEPTQGHARVLGFDARTQADSIRARSGALLASRISDRAILLGKIMVTVGTSWVMALASLLLGMFSANLASGQGRWAFYGSFVLLLEALTLSLLTSLLATSAGVLISLRAATVRQAQQTLALSAVVLLGALLLATRAVPAQVLLTPATSAPQLWLVVMAALVVLDTILLGATFISFQRSRLI